jgi:DNA-binding CsgD family transcriptional regulator
VVLGILRVVPAMYPTVLKVADRFGVSVTVVRRLLDLQRHLSESAEDCPTLYRILLERMKELVSCDWCSISIMAAKRRFIGGYVYPSVNFDYETVLPALDATLDEQVLLDHVERNSFAHTPVHQEYIFDTRGVRYVESGLYREAYRLLDCRDQIGIIIHSDDIRDAYSGFPCYAYMNFVRSESVFSGGAPGDEVKKYARILHACNELVLSQTSIKKMIASHNREVYVNQRVGSLSEDELTSYPHEEFLKEFLYCMARANCNEVTRWASMNHLVSIMGDHTGIRRYAQSERVITLSMGVSKLVRQYQEASREGFRRSFVVSDINNHDPVVAKMSKRQKEVIAGITLGYNTDAIAQNLGVSKRTVESHLYAVQDHLGIPNGEFDKRIVMALRFSRNDEIKRLANAMRLRDIDS